MEAQIAESKSLVVMRAPKTRIDAVGPFAQAAQELQTHRLAVLPLGRESGKEPLVSFGKWANPPGAEFIRKLIATYSDANIGIVCHLSGVTVVDIDDPTLVEAMLERFGDTPLRTQTPSGGIHLWYRHSGERNRNLRSSENLAVDIKGVNGIIAVPPSIRSEGEHAGKAYEFISGTWAELVDLPIIPPGALSHYSPTPLRKVERGRRNGMLLKSLLKEARYCDSEADLVDVARTIGESFPEPLPDAEILKTARSAWSYEVRGENWSGKEARFPITRSSYDALKSDSDALNLFICLKLNHGTRKHPFAVSPKAMREADTIPGWGVDRYRNARNKLEKLEGLKCIHRGGRRRHDPSMFTLGTPVSK